MDNHVKISVGRNFSECTPIKGTYKGFATHTLSVSVSIGYEDGNNFEEINDIQLQKQSIAFQEELDNAEQQQQ